MTSWPATSMRPMLALLDHDCVKHTCKLGYCDKPSQFKHIALSKMPSHEDTLVKCLHMDFLDGGESMDFSRHNLAAKAQVMSIITKELGIEHAGKAHEWGKAEFNDIIEKLDTPRHWEDLDGESSLQNTRLWERAFYVFGLNDRSEEEGHFSPAERMKSHLDRIFSAWCLSTVELDRNDRKYVYGNRTPHKVAVYTGNTPPKDKSGNVSNYLNELRKTPEFKAAKTEEEEEALKTAAKAKWDVDYPKVMIAPFNGAKLVPWKNLKRSDDPTTGLLWSLVVPYKATAGDTVGRGRVAFLDEDE